MAQYEKRDTIQTLSFRYELTASYSAPIRRHNFTVSFLPGDTARQQVLDMAVSIPGCEHFRQSLGAFGSRRVYGLLEEPHTDFSVVVFGQVKTGLDIFEDFGSNPLDSAVFRVQSALTQPGPSIRAFHDCLNLNGSAYDRALAIRRAVHEAFSYQPGATSAHESGEKAFARKQGVCQDYAHVMLSLLRMEGIPARYVTGMLLGEGASHAWVEAQCGGYWYGFDPTNDLLVDDSYIRVSCGRDSADCAIIRGTFLGWAAQMQREQVTVEIKELL